MLRIAQELGDRAIEARAYAGLGHAARCAGDYKQVCTICIIIKKKEKKEEKTIN